MRTFEMCVPCLFGLESFVAAELKELGAEEVVSEDGRVFFHGTAVTMMDANLWLRCGERVEIVLGRFPARSFEELFEGVRKLPWEAWIPAEGRFPVKGYALNSKLHSVPDCQSIIKKAVVKRLEGAYRRSVFPESGALYSVRFSLMKDQATLMIDTSGAALHKRGYRPGTQPAPIRETLGAAMIAIARPYPDTVLYDPMCGSGTLLIEAAMKMHRIAPGLTRSFAAEGWEAIGRERWAERRKAAREQAEEDLPFRCVGSDLDPAMIAAARENAKHAGVDRWISFSRADVRAFQPETPRGMAVTNPPYGERLLDKEQARELYRELGKVFLKKPGWRYYVIAPDPDFEKLFGRQADKKRKVHNGPLVCNIYQYFKT